MLEVSLRFCIARGAFTRVLSASCGGALRAHETIGVGPAVVRAEGAMVIRRGASGGNGRRLSNHATRMAKLFPFNRDSMFIMPYELFGSSGALASVLRADCRHACGEFLANSVGPAVVSVSVAVMCSWPTWP